MYSLSNNLDRADIQETFTKVFADIVGLIDSQVKKARTLNLNVTVNQVS